MTIETLPTSTTGSPPKPGATADRLDTAIADWLLRREDDPSLMPAEFADDLPADLRSGFLAEIEALGQLDRLADAPPRDLPLRLGGYRVLGLLGEGATGTVYEAEQIALGRRVALKVLHAAVADHKATRRRFDREARVAAALDHPSIVRIHDVGQHDGITFLVMQRAPGRDLRTLVHAHHDPAHTCHALATSLLGDRQRLAASFAAIAEALAYAHARGVVHRDVKPANLVLDERGHPTVLDFGLARATDSGPELTRAGDVLGTPLYMSPEQLAGRSAGPASDLWSFGCVLFECLTGQPVAGPIAIELDDLPPAFAPLVRQCLVRDPARRCQDAAGMANALRAIAAAADVTSRRS
jgi:serine/threonine protein kinase